MERNYTLNVGDVVLIKEPHWGFRKDDLDKYVRVVGYSKYISDGSPALLTVPYDCELMSTPNKDSQWKCGYESFGDNPMVLLNVNDEPVCEDTSHSSVKIRVNTMEHEYQGLYYGTGIEGCILGVNGEAYFFHNGKQWMLDTNEFQLLTGLSQDEKGTSVSVSALDKQVSGDHYKDCKIQPIEYIHANGLSYLEGNVIKYTTRHSKKNGKADIEKAIHYLELILEMEYK